MKKKKAATFRPDVLGNNRRERPQHGELRERISIYALTCPRESWAREPKIAITSGGGEELAHVL